MHTARKIALVLAAPLLSIAIFLGVTAWSLQTYFADSSMLKVWLAESGIYPAARTMIVTETTKDNSIQSSTDEVTFSDKLIERSLNRALTAEYLQSAAEQFIDGTYAWLQGDVEVPSYNIDVTSLKTAFANEVVASARKRLTSLPPCVLADQATTTDPFTTNCNPPKEVTQKELARLKKEIIASKDFLPADITAATTNISQGSQPAESAPWYQGVAHFPRLFQLTMVAPYVFSVLAVVMAVVIVFASQTKRRGAKTIAVTTLTSSAALALSAGILLFFVDRFSIPVSSSNAELQEPLIVLFKSMSNAVSRWQLITSLVLVVLSGLGLLALRLTRPGATPPGGQKTVK